MADYPTLPRMGDLDGNGKRRRSTDIAPPLDYETKELVSEFIEGRQRPASPLKSLMKKLRRSDNE
jgi:hypothetical protein